MTRIRRISIGAINVVLHPHSPELYDQLLSHACDSFAYGKIRGLDWGVIGTKSPWDAGSEMPVIGSFWRFINIDPEAPWANLKTRRAQSPGETPIIPPELKPHLRKDAFVFFPKGHRLFFDATRFSPISAAKMLRDIFSDTAIQKQFGDVDVHVETSSEAIERIKAMHRLASIELFISMPNPDDNEDEQRVMNRLDGIGAKKVDEKYTARRGGSITPDEELDTRMKVARSNGYVKAVGYSQDETRAEICTKKHPLRSAIYYQPDDESVMDVLIREGRRLLRQITGK